MQVPSMISGFIVPKFMLIFYSLKINGIVMHITLTRFLSDSSKGRAFKSYSFLSV